MRNKYSEQDIYDIMYMNSQGLSAREIALRRGERYIAVLAVVKENGGTLRKGLAKSIDGTSKHEQIKALWDSGLHSLDMIADKVSSPRKSVLWVLNNRYGISTRDNALDEEAQQIAQRQLKGEYTHGEISKLARKHKVTKQAAHQRVQKFKGKT